MPVIGITGGIASGKSTVTRLLVNHLHNAGAKIVEAFSADDFSHQLLASDSAVRNEIQEIFGSEFLDIEGGIDRGRLREAVFEQPTKRKALESILHPRVHQAWREKATRFRQPKHYFVAEIPLLYETNSADYFDCIVVVEADAQVQLERLSSKRGWSLETASRVIDAQMPADEKRQRANILILNHHTENLLNRQIALAAQGLLMRYA